MNLVRRCLLHAVMVFVILPCGPCGTSCLWRPPRAPHPLLNLDSSEIPRLGRVKEKRWGKSEVCSTFNMSKTSCVLKPQVQTLLPRKWFFVPLTRDPPEWSATACVEQRTNKFRRGGCLRLTADLWPSLSVLVCSGASGRVRWCFRWGLWLMAVALVALKLHHFIQQFLHCH